MKRSAGSKELHLQPEILTSKVFSEPEVTFSHSPDGKLFYLRHLYVFIGGLEMFLFCGIIFGWPQFRSIFVKEGFNQCGSIKNGSMGWSIEDQELCQKWLSTVFTSATTCYSGTCFIGGLIMDHYGTRALRLISNVLLTGGSLVLAFSDPGGSGIDVIIGYVLIAIGGINLLATQFQIANLYKEAKGLVLGILLGMNDSSCAMALIMSETYRLTSYRSLWIGYAALTSVILIRTIFLMPKTLIPNPLPKGYRMDVTLPSRHYRRYSTTSEERKRLSRIDENLIIQNHLNDQKAESQSKDSGKLSFFQLSSMSGMF